jgi:hypothetical protein
MSYLPRAGALVVLSLLAIPALAGEAAPVAVGSATAQPAKLPQARFLAVLRTKIPIDPVGIKTDPYLTWGAKQPPLLPAGTLCGVRFEPDRVHYRIATFASKVTAGNGGYAVTHYGACGTCSTLQDLAVYLEKPDLTAPVRRCGMMWEESSALECLEALGFSTPCARTWLYNVENTRRHCFSVCMWSWIEDEAPTRADGRLNDCLQCDEDRSGPVFKATAGRTRRNSGIRSSIPRFKDEIAPLVHDYIPDVVP